MAALRRSTITLPLCLLCNVMDKKFLMLRLGMGHASASSGGFMADDKCLPNSLAYVLPPHIRIQMTSSTSTSASASAHTAYRPIAR